MKRRIYLGIFVSLEAFLSWVTEEAKILKLSGQGEPCRGSTGIECNKGNHEMAFGDEGFELLPYHESRRSLSFAFGFMWMK